MRPGDRSLRLDDVTDWVLGPPLRIVLIIVVALVVSWLGRRFVRRATARFVGADRVVTTKTLERIGVPRAMMPGSDPRRKARADAVGTVMASTVTVIVWVIAVLLVLDELGIDLAPLIAGAGIAGIAIGFGAQSVVRDCLAGLFMLAEDQYGIGDVVDLGEATGTVERVTLRTTVLRGYDGTVWHVPNGEVRRVGNRSQLWSVAVVDIPVGPTADVATARRFMAEVAADVVGRPEFTDIVLAEPEVLGVESVSAHAVTLRLTVRTTPGKQFGLERALREAIQRSFDRESIPMPSPGFHRGAGDDA